MRGHPGLGWRTQDERNSTVAGWWQGKALRGGGAALIAVSVWGLTLNAATLPPAGKQAVFVLVLSVGLWVTEAIPAHAVGLLIIGLAALIDGLTPSDAPTADWIAPLHALGDPLIWLFLGGFFLAAGMERCGLDRRLALVLLRPVQGSYRLSLLVVMLTSFVLSMFMSNTATAAMMLAVLGPSLLLLPAGSTAGKGLLLGIAAGSNLGGLGTIIGTPPNALAAAAMARHDPPLHVGFTDWMLLAAPPALISLLAVWMWLAGRNKVDEFHLELEPRGTEPTVSANRPGTAVVTTTLLLTIGLWLTTEWHGAPAAVVALVPIVLLTLTGVLSAEDLRGLHYDVLFLLAGGLALGELVRGTGLAGWLVEVLPTESLSPIALVGATALLTVVLANFMSHTAAANILLPLGLSLAGETAGQMGLAIAFAASSAMCLPVSTPPNALIHATGRLSARDFLGLGLLTGLLTPGLGILWSSWLLGRFVTLSAG